LWKGPSRDAASGAVRLSSVVEKTHSPLGRGSSDEAAAALRAGQLVVLPTDTVYGLCADAYRERPCLRLFAAKQRPANGYAGKFSTPYCIAASFLRGNVGLSDFADAAVRDPAVVALAGKVRYQIDPNNPYPKNFTGHIRAVLNDGRVVEERQPHMRGGAHEPLTRADIEEKFALNAAHGGWSAARIKQALALLRTFYDGRFDLTPLRG